MKTKVWLYVAAILMTFLGLLRGIGGLALLARGNKTDLGQPIVGSSTEIMIAGLGLVLVLLLFIASSLLLVFSPQPGKGKTLGWIGLVVFLAGGIINSYLLFAQSPLPDHLPDQLFNFSVSIVIAILLSFGLRKRPA
jgi:hypothetical protein